MNELFIELGKYLRSHRKLKGLSQSEVAKSLGYSTPQFVSNFERGLCAPPLNKLKLLISLYELHRDEVIQLMLDQQEKHLRRQLTE